MEVITQSAEETKDFGRKTAANLNGGQTLALTGDLGSGKTTFVQGFAEGLGHIGRIISPTFILMRKYDLPDGDFYHVDLYRFEDNVEKEVENIGLRDIWGNKDNIVVIEWAEKIKNLLPENTKWLKFEMVGENERKITVE
ncbi:MAG TPA: tRNA (adenosine(37)-N6)-threonylcarbamoyltransferase complex ATPase subunit type 1 TsaE [Patescibacteria group bacterium]|uniref:tRNA threonylcarbamoyladenosine biosynthesis protein TsaE n=1 Tax=Candidatus Woesebacteria bacterium RBG_13_46_13 TaxID=1802479 RepID=A0A1F7X5U5_9BACT|nr:MAG: tRNA (adenosine(37)-N6)-threonylcarbamoyltransferase complex ATPase subunit type 1 TsaE [Candidatus Woesebacteria bacterium RBG_13_46_13]HJX59059.1 tRNA (adenosine(37)-N6)-threonylcarbamoyltransferase complex ATPase subunit type 1 TsaE [Patescibacteria group bacterium]